MAQPNARDGALTRRFNTSRGGGRSNNKGFFGVVRCHHLSISHHSFKNEHDDDDDDDDMI